VTGTSLSKEPLFTGFGDIQMKSVQALMLEEERPSEVKEDSDLVLRYELQFLGDDERAVHKVEVRSINFQDIIRHLRQGDSVLITPKSQGDLHKKKNPDQGPWYFMRM
jgi:hypothetical protein